MHLRATFIWLVCLHVLSNDAMVTFRFADGTTRECRCAQPRGIAASEPCCDPHGIGAREAECMMLLDWRALWSVPETEWADMILLESQGVPVCMHACARTKRTCVRTKYTRTTASTRTMMRIV